jgi:hypothetical protein
MAARAAWIAMVVSVACSSGSTEPAPQPAPAPRDAAPVPGKTEIGTAPGLESDPRRDPRMPREGGKKQPARPIELMLKSTPERAMAAVDGIQIGLTPVYWFGEADGREHEFTFVKENFALSRHRFVPVQSGVVHATLTPVLVDQPDAGVAPAPPAPPPTPPPAPPPTVLAPDAAPAPPPITPPAPPTVTPDARCFATRS